MLPSSSVRVQSMLSDPENGLPATGKMSMPCMLTRVLPSDLSDGAAESCARRVPAKNVHATNPHTTIPERNFIEPTSRSDTENITFFEFRRVAKPLGLADPTNPEGAHPSAALSPNCGSREALQR